MSKSKKQIDPLTLVSEKEWTQQVVDLAHIYHWRVAHFRAAMTKYGWKTPIQGDKGFPDLVLVRGDRLIFAELKAEGGNLSKEQKDWLIACEIVARGLINIKVFCWYPSDFDMVQGILK